MSSVYIEYSPSLQVAERFKGRYRIPSARWATWDYGAQGAYFITINIHDRSHQFGEVCHEKVLLTALGKAALSCWESIPEHFPHVHPDTFVVMPNHVHGILFFDGSATSQRQRNRFGPQSRNLASVVRGFKIGVTMYARRHDLPFGWQARYFDRVIRSAEEYARISRYILENPIRWTESHRSSR